MSALYAEYQRLRSDGYTAAQATSYAKRAMLRKVQLMMLGLDTVPRPFTGSSYKVNVEVGGVAYEIEVDYADNDNYWYGDGDFTLDSKCNSSNEEQEGWGWEGRVNGRYVNNTGRDTQVIVLPADMGLLPLMKELKGSKQMRFEEACRRQNDYIEWARNTLDGSEAEWWYTVRELSDEDTDREYGHSSSDDAFDSALAHLLYRATR